MHQPQIKKKKAFTLVELIIVITILTILSSIAFISFQNYTKDTRDSVRLVDIKQIYNWLDIERIKTEKTPLPEKYIEVTDGTKILTYQWYVWERILRQIKINNWWQDPLTKWYYTYTTDPQNKKIQLMTYLETSNKEVKILWKLEELIKQANATTNSWYYQDKHIYIYWDKIWILTDKNKVPLQETTTNTWIDLTTNTQELTTYFWWDIYDWWKSTSTWVTLINEINWIINNLTDNKYSISWTIANWSWWSIFLCWTSKSIEPNWNFLLDNINYWTNCSSIKIIKNWYDCSILNDWPISLSSNIDNLIWSCDPWNCISRIESVNSHDYLIPTISHWTNTWGILSYDVNENNWVYKYKLENVNCYYWSFVNLTEGLSPITQSCWIDYYKDWDTCSQVWIWEYSTLWDINKHSCTLKPINSVFISRWNWEDNCNRSCNLWYGWSNCDTLISVTITYSSSDSTWRNLYDDAKNSLYATPMWDWITPTTLNIVVSTWVVIWSLNTATSAITISNTFPIWMIININNNWYIVWAWWTWWPWNDWNGYNGWNALKVLYSVNIVNNWTIAWWWGWWWAWGRAWCPWGGRAWASWGWWWSGFSVGIWWIGWCDAWTACWTQWTSGNFNYWWAWWPINYGNCSWWYWWAWWKWWDLWQSWAHWWAWYSSNWWQGGWWSWWSAWYSIDWISYVTYTKAWTILWPTK